MLGLGNIRTVRRTITFDGTAGKGVVGTVAVFNVTGAILCKGIAAVCKVDLAGATATVEVGTASDTDGLIAQATATGIDAPKVYVSASPSNLPTLALAAVDKIVSEDVNITVATADVTAGQLEITMLYIPLSGNGGVT